MRVCHLYDPSEVFSLTNIAFVQNILWCSPIFTVVQQRKEVTKTLYNLISVARDVRRSRCPYFVVFLKSSVAKNTAVSNISRTAESRSILPLSKRFDLYDLISFHQIVYSFSPLDMPGYLSRYCGTARLKILSFRQSQLCISNPPQYSICNHLTKSFFHRTHLLWNTLPFDISEMNCTLCFKKKLAEYFWIMSWRTHYLMTMRSLT